MSVCLVLLELLLGAHVPLQPLGRPPAAGAVLGVCCALQGLYQTQSRVLAQGQPEGQALTQDTARHASLPLPGAMPARSALPQFDPSSVFGSAAAQSFDAPWPGHAPEPAGALYPGGGSGEDPGGDSLAPLEGGPGASRGGDAGAQRRTESEPVAAFARGRAPVNFLGEYVARQHALGQGALAADAGGARCEKMHSSTRDQAGFKGSCAVKLLGERMAARRPELGQDR